MLPLSDGKEWRRYLTRDLARGFAVARLAARRSSSAYFESEANVGRPDNPVNI